MNPPQSESTSARKPDGAPRAAQPASLAKRITGWTTTLLATSVVVVVALACGSQLVWLWGQDPSASKTDPPATMAAWPTMESCAIVFGNRPYQLKREQFQGDRDEVIDHLIRQCREQLETDPEPVGPTGTAEAKMISDAAALQPVVARADHWRLFQVEDPQGKSLPMVIGIRDDCRGESASRLVTWGMGLTGSDGHWTTYVCRTAAKTRTNAGDLENLPLPEGCQRTLSIGDHNGGRLIGFAGGRVDDSIRFFDHWARSQGWSTTNAWRRSGQIWHARFARDNLEKTGAISVQLAVDPSQTMRGLLMIEPNTLNALNRNATE